MRLLAFLGGLGLLGIAAIIRVFLTNSWLYGAAPPWETFDIFGKLIAVAAIAAPTVRGLILVAASISPDRSRSDSRAVKDAEASLCA